MKKNQLCAAQITAIGSHGQTIRHEPPDSDAQKVAFTLQIGDPNTIAEQTGISTVADFRRKDIAAGGQGAPLVPAFHRELFRSKTTDRIILNIGGMSNITLLEKDSNAVLGFDTGPGNILMDIWVHLHKQTDFDHNGEWAASGNYNDKLLQIFLDEDYFRCPPPKSTGRELFNEVWLNKKLQQLDEVLAPEDIQTTLLKLTTTTIDDSIASLLSKGEIIICGGGARNGHLLKELKNSLPNFVISTTNEHGIESDSVEAVAFAWLAQQTMQKNPIDFTQITGASYPIIMGGIYYSES